LKFHNTAQDVLVVASSGIDQTSLAFWDLTSQEKKIDITEHKQQISDFDFNHNGKYVVTTSKDKAARIFDVRASTSPVCTFLMPENLRDCGVNYLGDSGFIMTYGFAKGSSRQISFWDSRKLSDLNNSTVPVKTHLVDNSNSQLSPYYVEDNRILYVGSIGDRIIKLYQFNYTSADEEKGSVGLDELGSYQSNALIKGLSWFPRTDLNIQAVEIAKAYRLAEEDIREITFVTPRKRKEYFQDDIYPPTRQTSPLYTAAEFFSGLEKEPERVDLQPAGMGKLSEAPPEELSENEMKRAAMKKEQEIAKKKNHPTMTDHFKSYEGVAETYPKANRWDAKPQSNSEVADDEW
jgi:hypothetical protein